MGFVQAVNGVLLRRTKVRLRSTPSALPPPGIACSERFIILQQW